MQTLDLDEDNPINAAKPFWRRQFQEEATESQIRFDWIFGVVVPVICFYFDPTVFRSIHGDGLLASYKAFAYVLSFTSIMSMLAWLLWGARLKWLTPFLAGLFGIGSLVSLAIGIFLLPFSLLGLIFLIGALGFTPLLTAFTFFRNSVRAVNAASNCCEAGFVLRAVVLSAAWSAAFPFVVNAVISRLVNEMATGDPRTITVAASKLRYVMPIASLGPVLRRYKDSSEDEAESLRMKTMKESFRDLTGESIEEYGRGLCFLDY